MLGNQIISSGLMLFSEPEITEGLPDVTGCSISICECGGGTTFEYLDFHQYVPSTNNKIQYIDIWMTGIGGFGCVEECKWLDQTPWDWDNWAPGIKCEVSYFMSIDCDYYLIR